MVIFQICGFGFRDVKVKRTILMVQLLTPLKKIMRKKDHEYLNGALYIVYLESRSPLSPLCEQIMILILVKGVKTY